ncbi:MAG: aldolase [Patescibacteria group bacterium]|nr:aldolase [Patescibacteria group bacterium]
MTKISIPLSVPKGQQETYLKNYKLATKNTGRLFLFAGDQKVEHLNNDFYGAGISPEDANPEHLFKIAAQVPGAVLATHIGLLSHYGQDYKQLPFILKINGKSPLNSKTDEAISSAWLDMDKIIRFKKQSKLNIVGLGYTIYLGSSQEAQMLKEAAEMINVAHQNGLLAIIWMYPRNSKIKNEDDPHLIAGGAGVAACLGADFVKVKYPYKIATSDKKSEAFKEVIAAAGKTKVICVGGSKQDSASLLKHLDRQLKTGSSGLAIGRNMHQRSLEEASSLGKAIAAMLHGQATHQEAINILKAKPSIKKVDRNKSRMLGIFSF